MRQIERRSSNIVSHFANPARSRLSLREKAMAPSQRHPAEKMAAGMIFSMSQMEKRARWLKLAMKIRKKKLGSMVMP